MLEPPKGCLEIPGVLLVIEPGRLWLSKDGVITDKWHERGIWATKQDAINAIETFISRSTGCYE
jgi:hypothetical protein